MKILVLSLLRVGDLLQQQPLLRSLRARHPAAEIHLLTNTSVSHIRPLFPEVDLWHVFDRDLLQKSIGTAAENIFAPVRVLEELLQDLASEHFDLLLNFTHTRLSAHLASLIPAQEKKGLLADGLGFRSFENSWLRHFNERFGCRDGSPFHYAEILAGAFELGELRPPRAKIRGELVLLQPLTSDAKKEWGLASWRRLVDQLKQKRPGTEIRVLGAPFEAERLRQVFDDEELEIADWPRLQMLLSQSALVISGDTSVKHLAALNGIPVLEIALGSSDPSKTGAFLQNSWLVQSTVDCAPCSHSAPCRRLSHLCGESIPAREILTWTLDLLEGRKLNPPREGSTLRLWEGTWTSHVGWKLRPVGRDATDFLADAVDQTVWRLFLDGEKFPPLGSAARDLRGLDPDAAAWIAALDCLVKERKELKTLFEQSEKRLQVLSRMCFSEGFDPILLQAERRSLTSQVPLNRRVRRHWQELVDVGHQSFASPLNFFGAIRRKLDELQQRLLIQEQMIQQLREGGRTHGQTNRDSLVRSLETP